MSDNGTDFQIETELGEALCLLNSMCEKLGISTENNEGDESGEG